MEYKRMSDALLAEVVIEYIHRLDNLMDILDSYLQGNSDISTEEIRAEYARIKEQLRADAKYVSLSRNSAGSELYVSIFIPSIKEAAAWGMSVPINAKVDHEMFSAIEEAHYKLTKFYMLNEWENVK